jgi:TrmH family RNA methyltransferase
MLIRAVPRSVSSRQNPIVRTFRELAAHPPADGRRMLLDGVHLVQEAHAAGLKIVTLAITHAHIATRSQSAALADVLAHQGTDVVEVAESVMSALSPVRSPSGVVAIAERHPALAREVCDHRHALIIAPTDVQDPGNLGALLRASEAMGVTGCLVCGASANPFSWKALRGSMGSALRLPIAAGLRPEAGMAYAKQSGLKTIAAVPRAGRTPSEVAWVDRLILFIGGEGRGLPEEVIDDCNERVTIPMATEVESLNVAVAGAVLVYEARRQRELVPNRFR